MNNQSMPQPTPPASRRSVLSPTAFTLVEMLVVVSIIVILSTLLIIGIGKLQTSSRRQLTQQMLGNCQALWAEYDSVARPHTDVFDFVATPSVPGNVSTGGTDRYSAPVFLTQSMFALMRSNPGVRASIDKFSAGKMTIPPQLIPGTPTKVPIYPGGYAANMIVKPGNVIGYTDPSTGVGETYLCIHNDVSLTSGTFSNALAPQPPPDPGYWMPIGGYSGGMMITDLSTPILLDAWNNPIICVVGGKLSNINAGGQSSTVVYSPDKRLFFASAGPDGSFTSGDDNMYSFEKP